MLWTMGSVASVSGLAATGATAATGSEYVSVSSPDDWGQVAKLTASDGDRGDGLGEPAAVSADGTTAVVGANNADTSNSEEAGAAYVFSADGGEWTLEAKLTANDGAQGDLFGSSVSISGDGSTAVIGAHNRSDSEGVNRGGAYVFSNGGGGWTQRAILTANDTEGVSSFGEAVTISGDGATAVVGAPSTSEPNGHDAGAAYVFSRSGEGYTQTAKLVAEDGGENDAFGESIAVSNDGDTAIIGTPGDGERQGSVYVFEREGDAWVQRDNFGPSVEEGDGVAESLAISDDGATVVAGSPDDAGERGSVYVYAEREGSWERQAKLTPDEGGGFGSSVATSGDGSTLVVGVPSYGEGDTGLLAVFTRSDGEWTRRTTVTATGIGARDRLGSAVAISDDGTLTLAGAPYDETQNGRFTGSAYVFDASVESTDTTTAESRDGTTTPTAEASPATTATSGSGPGFGVVSPLVGVIGTVGYLLRRDDD